MAEGQLKTKPQRPDLHPPLGEEAFGKEPKHWQCGQVLLCVGLDKLLHSFASELHLSEHSQVTRGYQTIFPKVRKKEGTEQGGRREGGQMIQSSYSVKMSEARKAQRCEAITYSGRQWFCLGFVFQSLRVRIRARK